MLICIVTGKGVCCAVMNEQRIVIASTGEISGSRSDVFEAGTRTSNLPDLPSLKIDCDTDTLKESDQLRLRMNLARFGFSIVSTVKRCSPADGMLIEGESSVAAVYFHLGLMYDRTFDGTRIGYELGVTPKSLLSERTHKLFEYALRSTVTQFTNRCAENIIDHLQNKI